MQAQVGVSSVAFEHMRQGVWPHVHAFVRRIRRMAACGRAWGRCGRARRRWSATAGRARARGRGEVVGYEGKPVVEPSPDGGGWALENESLNGRVVAPGQWGKARLVVVDC